jgi:hypothetical protein
MFFTHVRSDKGRPRRSYRDEALSTVLAAAKNWIHDALASPLPIPMLWAGPYTGAASTECGGLMVSVLGDDSAAIVEIRIGSTSVNAVLWPFQPGPHDGLPKPPEPWCYTDILAPAAAPGDEDLIVIENALAWAWQAAQSLQIVPR